MKSPEADKFFQALAMQLDEPVTVFLTGAIAGAIFGNVRSSADIDFAIVPKGKGQKRWERIHNAILQTSSMTGISIQYARDIDRWGMISLLDYRRKAVRYRKFGTIDVRALNPIYWAIGKFTRYLKPDIQDLVAVFKKKKIPPAKLTKTLGKALRQSPPSSQGFQFRQHVEQFLGEYGRRIWGAQFKPDDSIRVFHQAAGIKL